MCTIQLKNITIKYGYAIDLGKESLITTHFHEFSIFLRLQILEQNFEK
jgi:hypothetical protein